jgi:protein-tyrosine phosphatase
MFREVKLPKNVSGQLYLHSMPGRYEAWSDFATTAKQHKVNLIVCLAPEDEIEMKSPSYANAIKNDELCFSIERFPIPDYGVPQDQEQYAAFVTRIAKSLRSGHKILVHCGAGIGRTGTFAICLLLALGPNRIQAEKATHNAGSQPETDEQRKLVSWCEKKFQTA